MSEVFQEQQLMDNVFLHLAWPALLASGASIAQLL
jgi:hypothetical protein